MINTGQPFSLGGVNFGKRIFLGASPGIASSEDFEYLCLLWLNLSIPEVQVNGTLAFT